MSLEKGRKWQEIRVRERRREMEEERLLGRVFCFQDAFSFGIPHEWVEGDEGQTDYYLYHAPDTESGWLRVSLITLKVEEESPAERLDRLRLQWTSSDGCDVTVQRETGNVVKTWQSGSKHDPGLHLYWWEVGSAVPPQTVRRAMFSYTVKKELIHDRRTVDTVDLIGALVGQTEFKKPLECN